MKRMLGMMLVLACAGVALSGCGQAGPLSQRPGSLPPIAASGINGLTAYSMSGVG